MKRNIYHLWFILLGLSALVSHANAAIILGSDNGDGTWSIGDVDISVSSTGALVTTFSRDIELASLAIEPYLLNQPINHNVSSSTSLARSQNNDIHLAAGVEYFTLGNLYLLLSLEENETDWDTVVVVEKRFAANGGNIIHNVLHDNAATNEDILSGVIRFDQIEASVVPEPGALLLFGVASVALLRRKRWTKM